MRKEKKKEEVKEIFSKKLPTKNTIAWEIFLPRGVIGLDDRIISGNLVNRYVTRVKVGEGDGEE